LNQNHGISPLQLGFGWEEKSSNVTCLGGEYNPSFFFFEEAKLAHPN